jgi:endonuclease/exonuclease/phosphatase family metal-dependent hydrolase
MPRPGAAARRLATVAALPWAVWAGLRAAGAERGFPLVPALAFTPYAAVTAVLPLGLAAWARSRTGAALSVTAGAALAAAVLARSGRSGAIAVPDGVRLRVATVSLRLGRVAPGPVLDLVRRHDVDVLAVQELTPESEYALRAAGLEELLPYAHVIPARPGSVPAASGAVWSRRPLHGRGAVPGAFEQPTVRLRFGDGPDVEVTAVHIVPPATSPRAVRTWILGLEALPPPEPGVLRVLAGDFNATLDHAALRAVLRHGYVDAARAVGSGLTWTWRPLRLPFPRLVLDHVLVDPRIGVAGVDLVAVHGSDHRAVVAELVVSRAGRPEIAAGRGWSPPRRRPRRPARWSPPRPRWPAARPSG